MNDYSLFYKKKATSTVNVVVYVDDIVLTGKDLALELGMGFDLYFKYFKFSPEIRFSHGLNNLYRAKTTDPQIASAISEIRKKSITIYLNFQ